MFARLWVVAALGAAVAGTVVAVCAGLSYYAELHGLPPHITEVRESAPAAEEGAEYDAEGEGTGLARLLERTERHPSNPQAWMELAHAYYKNGDYAKAESAGLRAAGLGADNPLAWYNLACYQALAGEADAALSSLAQALRLDPELVGRAQRDADLDPLRDDPRFGSLLMQAPQADEVEGDSQTTPTDEELAGVESLMAVGDLAGAADELARLRSVRDDDADVAGTHAALLLQLDRCEEATEAAARAVELAPESADAWNRLGLAHHLCGRYDEAVAAWAQTLSREPDHLEAVYNTACALSLGGKSDEALQYLKKALSMDPSLAAHARADPDLLPLAELPRFAELIGREYAPPSSAEDLARSLMERIERQARGEGAALGPTGPGGLSEAEDYAADHPDDAGAHARLGMAYMEAGRLEDGIGQLRAAVELDPEFLSARLALSQALLSFGGSRDDDDALDEALDHTRYVIERQPESLPAHATLVGAAFTLYRRSGRDALLAEAEASLRVLSELDPDAALVYYNLARALALQGKVEDAEAALADAVGLDARLAVPAAAEADFESLPGLPDILEAATADEADAGARLHNLYVRGVSAMVHDRYEVAEELLREAVTIDPGFAAAHDALGRTLYFGGRLDEALTHLQRATELDPQNADFLWHLADCLSEMGDIEGALRVDERMVELAPESADARYNVACDLARLGRYDEALARLEEAIALDPDMAESAAEDTDLDAMRDMPAFRKLIEGTDE